MGEAKRKHSKFWIIYITLTAVLVMAVAGVLIFLWNTLAAYQRSRPANLAETTLALFEAEDYDALLALAFPEGTELNEFDSAIHSGERIAEMASGKSVGYREKRGEYDEEAPVFSFTADNTEIAVLRLEHKPGGGRYKSWQIADFSFFAATDLTVTAPSDAAVYINGVKADEKYITEREIPFLSIQGLPAGTELPKMVKYTVSGLRWKPTVAAATGQSVSAKVTDNGNGAYTVAHTGGSVGLAEAEELTGQVATVYSNFVSGDAGFATVSKYLLRDSELYAKVRTLPTYFYAIHESWSIRDIKTSDYLYYSPDCFSMRISYDYLIYKYVKKELKEYVLPTDLTFTMIRLGGSWYIGAMDINGVSGETSVTGEE